MSDDNLENYAHKLHPNGHRYVGTVGNTPVWAVDVQPGDGKIRNAWGLEVHVTDEYVHYTYPEAEAKQLMRDMRDVWERVESGRASTDDLRFMMEAAAKYERRCADEAAAGDA
jgi:hypothetical protein